MDTKQGIVRFEDTEMKVVEKSGARWVTSSDVATAMGYREPKHLRELINQMAERGELKEGGHFIRSPLATAGGSQLTLLLSHRGVIRVAMRSDAPRAVQFRDWAEEVLFEVMITGTYGIQEEPDWTELLSPSELLRLLELRASIWLKLADRPRNRALWMAFYEAHGGKTRYAAHLRKFNERVPETREEWKAFERDIERQHFVTPEEWCGEKAE